MNTKKITPRHVHKYSRFPILTPIPCNVRPRSPNHTPRKHPPHDALVLPPHLFTYQRYVAIRHIYEAAWHTLARFSVLTGILVAHAEARAIGKHARGDVHGEEFLEEQFCGVRDVDLRDASFVVARPAFVVALLYHTGVHVSFS
jgi:hypothetical protein